jgi:deoxyribonuclease-4
MAAFAELVAHPATAGVPLVLETPGSRDPGDPQMGLLKALRDGERAR